VASSTNSGPNISQTVIARKFAAASRINNTGEGGEDGVILPLTLSWPTQSGHTLAHSSLFWKHIVQPDQA
jgi:hypothetical protein